MDRIPEIMDGKNVADYVDEDIDRKLALLEQEEDQLQVISPTIPPAHSGAGDGFAMQKPRFTFPVRRCCFPRSSL